MLLRRFTQIVQIVGATQTTREIAEEVAVVSGIKELRQSTGCTATISPKMILQSEELNTKKAQKHKNTKASGDSLLYNTIQYPDDTIPLDGLEAGERTGKEWALDPENRIIKRDQSCDVIFTTRYKLRAKRNTVERSNELESVLKTHSKIQAKTGTTLEGTKNGKLPPKILLRK